MNHILIGNIICLIGSLVMVFSGILKKKKDFLLIQILQFSIFTIGNFVLGAITGAVTNCVSIVRNVVCNRFGITLPLKIIFIAIQVALSIISNDAGLIGWLPIIAGCMFTYYMDLKDESKFKIMVIICQAMWIVYDFSNQNYTTFAFDIFATISNLIGLYRIKKDENKGREN